MVTITLICPCRASDRLIRHGVTPNGHWTNFGPLSPTAGAGCSGSGWRGTLEF